MPDPLMPQPESDKEKQLRQGLYRVIGLYPQLELMKEAAHEALDLAYPDQRPEKVVAGNLHLRQRNEQ